MRQLQAQIASKKKSQGESSKKEIDLSLIKKSIDNYNACAPKIERALALIEKSVREKRAIPQLAFKPEDFIELINNYCLLIQYIPLNESSDIINFKIPCAINILVLVGVFPKDDNFHGINLTKPCYPLNFSNKVKLAINNGIKNNEDYYLLKRVYKIHKGDFGDRTFLAVKADGSKLLYLNPSRPSEGILASKIARLISAKHFSSERLLDNGFAGSRELEGFISLVDPNIYEEQKKYSEIEKRVFPGTGIINEVQNYVGEQDPNSENIGFSSKDFQHNYLMKIDFDFCYLNADISKETYTKNILLKQSGIYKTQRDKIYLQESLYARIKLSLLTPELVLALAQKTKIKEDDLREIIRQYTTRSKICLELFLEDERTNDFLLENPEILTQCYAEISAYIEKHFENEKQVWLLSTLVDSIGTIQAELNKKFSTTVVYRAPEFVNNARFIKFETEIDFFIKKSQELDVRKFPEASLVAKILIGNLRNEIYLLEKEQTDALDFKKKCQKHIELAKPELEKHRGCKKLFVDLARLFGLQKLIQKGSFFHTDTQKKINHLENIIYDYVSAYING